MSTRNLSTNSNWGFNQTDKIISFTSTELIKSYKKALDDIRVKLVNLSEAFKISGELTKAQATQFYRLSNMEQEIVDVMKPYLTANTEFLKDMSKVGFDSGYFTHGWAMDQASGLDLGYGMIDDTAVRAATGISGDLLPMAGIMSDKEIKQHAKVLKKAFVNYDKDSVRWISEEIRQGIIKGESIPTITRRLKNSGMLKSLNSAELIARTEILRSSGIGSQISYDDARNAGVQLSEIWDATLDSRTRPSHASADGTKMDNETGMFDVLGGTPGPRRTGNASDDINCRCRSVAEVEGYSPELRNIRGEGLQPYQTFKNWATDKGYTVNRYGQKYNF